MTTCALLSAFLLLAALVRVKSYCYSQSTNFYWPKKPLTCLQECKAAKSTDCDETETETLQCLEDQQRGLLHGREVYVARYFTSSLPMKSMEDLNWLNVPGLAWEAVEMDAKELFDGNAEEYVAQMLHAAQALKARKDKVHDREEFYSFLNSMVAEKGTLSLVLGGKSVGKSLVLNDFKNQLNKREEAVLLVNARTFSGDSLATGILKEWKQLVSLGTEDLSISPEQFGNIFRAVLSEGARKFVGKQSKGEKKTVDQWFNSLNLATDPIFKIVQPEEALDTFVSYATLMGRHPVLIIDEANLVLGLGKGENATSRTLDAIVHLTKETGRLTVIMASSEYAFPYTLEAEGLNLMDVTKVLFAGEIPPKSMWELLVTEENSETEPIIGMGPNLARLMIDTYGGHFLSISSALELLNSKKEEFALGDGLPSRSIGVIKCLKEFPGALPILRSMAQDGFVPVADYESPVVKMIVKENVGGIVRRQGAALVSLPFSIWRSTTAKFGLVPSSETMRLVIAEEVCLEEERLARRWWVRLAFWRARSN